MNALNELLGNHVVMVLTLVFVAVIVLFEALYLLWRTHRGREAKKIAQRLALLANGVSASRERLISARQATPSAWERRLLALPGAAGLQTMLKQAGLNWSLARLVSVCAGTVLLAASLGGLLLPGLVLSWLLAGLVALPLPLLFIVRLRERRFARMQAQLPETVDVLVRALRAGHAFSAGLQMMGEEAPKPMASEFSIVYDEISFGVSLQQALFNLVERVPLTDLRYFTVAVLIQRESGGNLTEVLGKLSHLMRERAKLMRRVKVLSADGRMSAWVLGLMPFALGGLMYAFNPDFMSLLWKDPLGLTILKYTLGMMLVGAFILSRIIRIRV